METEKDAGSPADTVTGHDESPRGKRVAVAKRVRFEVFKRDKFACQYCGRKAPDVVLHIEHVKAVKHGGTNSLLNLITACSDCNLGKGAIAISDDAAISRQRAQMEELQDKREQQQMMFEWQRQLEVLQEEAVEHIHALYQKRIPGWSLNEKGLQTLRRLLRKYTVPEMTEALHVACDKHLQFRNGEPTQESVQSILTQAERIAGFRKQAAKDPDGAQLRYIRGIMRNRFSYCPDELALQLLEDAHAAGVTIADLARIAKRERNWTTWKAALETLTGQAHEDKRVFEDRQGMADSPEPSGATLSTGDSEWHEDRRLAVAQLQEQLTHLDTYTIWEMVGYAKGCRLLIAAEPSDIEESSPDEWNRQRALKLSIALEEEAMGLAKALDLVRSNQRSDVLLAYGEVTADQVFEMVTGAVSNLPREPYLIFGPNGKPTKVLAPLPIVESGNGASGDAS